MPLPDPGRFALVSEFEAAFRTIRAELDRLDVGRFQPWPLRGAYGGGWLVFPLLLRSRPPGWQVDFDANRCACPRTAELVLGDPRIATAAFSRMEPGCHIYPHTDHPMPGIVRSHLALEVPGVAKLRVRDEVYEWREGRGLVFDGCVPHEAANFADRARTIMLIDFELSAAERAEVGRVADQPTPTWAEPCVAECVGRIQPCV